VNPIARLLILAGLALLVAGVLVLFASKVPWLGKLPGDITFTRGNYTVYFPLGTCILVSVILTLVLWLFRK
jgi:thiosulfate reductase cytochrome b subunit